MAERHRRLCGGTEEEAGGGVRGAAAGGWVGGGARAGHTKPRCTPDLVNESIKARNQKQPTPRPLVPPPATRRRQFVLPVTARR